MNVTFNKADRALVAEELRQAGLYVDDKRIDDVLYNTKAAFLQQLPEEVTYMVNEFEMGE